ncbi:hypothetical protein DAEQUDRAFT_695816 [Daedalea quercina L-15889]|uniref:DUF6534 domain-containing protein n=1 Tax=Daedalea quercina L-15889 TaxID=1314783 RepID=A0A165MYY6_9APHY|nr:hypothetical protein DAEQUDRAFT_695816 [Daedalea quercina L-15889]
MATPQEKLAETTEGPALVGVFLNLTLFGIMISQAVFYFTNYSKDPRWIKAYVAFLVTADTLNAFFICAWIYRVLINNFGDKAALGIGDWLFETEQAFTGIVSFQVQMFYAWRIWKLIGNRFLVGLVAITATVGGLSGIGTAVAIGMRPDFLGFIHLKSIIILWLLGEGISDIIITVTLTWYLRRHLGGYSKTDGLVTRVMHLIVSNGLLTATFAIGDLICYFATDESWHLIFNFPLCKLYGNSVMSTLNARAIFMAPSNGPSSAYQSADQAPIRFNQGGRPDITGILATSVDKTHANQTQIMVNVETHEMTDIHGQENHPDDIKAGMVV